MDDTQPTDKLEAAVQAIVRRELLLSEDRMAHYRLQLEERLTARVNAAIDDLRSEVRALRLSDESLAARMTVLTQRVDGMSELNQEMIDRGMDAWFNRKFSPLRVVVMLTAVLSLVTIVVSLVVQLNHIL